MSHRCAPGSALFSFALALPLVVACGNVDPSGPDAGDDTVPDGGGGDDTAPDAADFPDADPGDVTPPAVAGITPLDGAAGVAADAVITIVFSEPMDRASVEAAWTSTDLPAAAVGFSWNPIGDTVTVTPAQPLALAEGVGVDPSVVAPIEYGFAIANSAADAAGNHLPAAITASFTTLRHMRVDLAQIDALCRGARIDAVFASGGSAYSVGDDTSNRQYKGFVGFGLPSLPAGAQLEAATLSSRQQVGNGLPYALGAIEALHINVSPITTAVFAGTPLGDVGVLSADGTLEYKSIDVTAAVANDLANHVARGERTQFRLEIPTASDNDGASDQAQFSIPDTTLSLTYFID